MTTPVAGAAGWPLPKTEHDSISDAGTIPVTVIVCARNREKVIGRCLSSIHNARPAQTILVDGHSADGTAEIARAYGVEVIDDRGEGLGAARQLGAESAKSDFLVYVDSDTVLRPDTLSALYREIRDGPYDAIQARLIPLPRTLTYWQRGERWRRLTQEVAGPASVLGCQATIVRRAVVTSVRFDRAFDGAGEDGDFWYRARACGSKIGHSHCASAYHEDRANAWSFIAQRVWHGRGLARVLVRHRQDYVDTTHEQASSVAPSLLRTVAYLPFMVTSAVALFIGVATEFVHIAVDHELRVALRTWPGGAPRPSPNG